MALQIRRGLNSQREQISSANPVLVGEFLYVTDQKKLYIGTGNPGEEKGIPISGYTDAEAIAATIPLLVHSTHNGITFTTNSSNTQITGTIDLSMYDGEIVASALRGSVFGDDSSLLIDASTNKIVLDGTISGNVTPSGDELYDIGSNTNRFRNLYLRGSTIFIDNATITASGSSINLPAGSTIGGNPIAMPIGDFTGSVFADDSTLLIDGTTGQIVGDINAKLGGNLNLNGYSVFGTGSVGADSLQTSNMLANSVLHVTDSGNGRITIKLSSEDVASVVKFSRISTVDISGDNTIPYGSIYFERTDPINGGLTTSIISGGNNFIRFNTISGTSYLDENALLWVGGKLGIGNVTPSEKLDVIGNAKISGFMQVGSLTSTVRDALTPTVGMIVYNSTTNKYQGFQNTNGTTLEWVNLS